MCALYAFCREIDDIVDDLDKPENERRDQLEFWKNDLEGLYNGHAPKIRIHQELQPFIHKYQLPLELFQELIRGVGMDFTIDRYSSLAELKTYCYRVASVVGLLSIEIFGYKNKQTQDYAVELGYALQLTNILRDIGCDAERNRIYIPQDLMAQHKVSESDILNGRQTESFRALAETFCGWAKDHFNRAKAVLPPEDKPAMVAAELMGSVYWRLLKRIEKSDFKVLGNQPIKLTKTKKLSLILRASARHMLGTKTSDYGS